MEPAEALADGLRGVAETLRHHRDLGFVEITLSRNPFSDRPLSDPPLSDQMEALRVQEQARAGCQLCKLCKSRSTIVFGVGNPRARLMVVGEGPGEEEDKQGIPFVGRAGQLLTKMLSARGVGFDRDRDCYIANVVKCRPERNRNPEPDEVAACLPYLQAQIELIQPKIILALGRFAAQTLLDTHEAVGSLRSRIHQYHGVPLVVTLFLQFGTGAL